MRFQGAEICEQGVNFAIAIVKHHVLQNRFEANRMLQAFQGVFGGKPVVLMAQDRRGVAHWYGRRDISEFMSRVPLRAVPWREYTYSGC